MVMLLIDLMARWTARVLDSLYLQIGAGGMGEVYRARDKRLNRIVWLETIASAMTLMDRLQ